MTRSVRTAAICAITTLASIGAGCGDDDDGSTDATTAVDPVPEAPTAGSGSTSDVDEAAYCAAELAVEEAFGALEEFTPEAVAGVQPLAHRLLEAAPDEIADEGAVLVAAIDAAATGDFSMFENPSFAAADATVHAFDVATCGYTQVDVRLVDYGFEGDLPTTAGLYSFEVANAGEEFHLFLLGRLEDDADGTAEEAFNAATEDTFADSFDDVGNVGIGPDGNDYLILDLTPGSYVLYCPIPVGSSAVHDFEGDGPPHFTQGMVTYFNVDA